MNEHIRRTVALNFSEPIWVRAEIAQLKESNGHYFFQLVEKTAIDDQLKAKADAVLWKAKHRSIRQKLGRSFDQVLQEGLQVSLLGKVDFDERYGFKLIIEDIDSAYTLGQLQIERQHILDKLSKFDLIAKNKRLAVPAVLQRIAILSSDQAAGYSDFVAQLNQNPYGYRFEGILFPIAVQGKHVAKDLDHQLNQINSQAANFDCVVILRGGGAKMDLASFDSYLIGEAIANSKLPVISGIGHEIDETIADVVAHTALKTPTAVAEFCIQHNAAFESHLDYSLIVLRRAVDEKVHTAKLYLSRLEEQLRSSAKQKIELQRKVLEHLKIELKQLCRQKLLIANKDVQKLEELSCALNLETNLKRGFTVTELEGKIVYSANDLQKGDKIMTRFVNGEKLSIVN